MSALVSNAAVVLSSAVIASLQKTSASPLHAAVAEGIAVGVGRCYVISIEELSN